MSQEAIWIKCRVTGLFLAEIEYHLREKAMRSGKKTETVSQLIRRAIATQMATDRRRWKSRNPLLKSEMGTADEVFNDPDNGININGEGVPGGHEDE